MSVRPILAASVLTLGCATTLTQRGQRALEAGIDPHPIVAALEADFNAISSTKRIFSVTLIEGRRRFAGEGAIDYQARPRRIQADVFGPHDAPIVHLRVVGDSVSVRLPQEGRILAGRFGDPAFAELAGEQALATPEVLGAILGAYDIPALVEDADWIATEVDGDRRVVFVSASGVTHALGVDAGTGHLVEYAQERGKRLIYRVRFDDFRTVDGRETPRRIVLRDFVKERQLVFEIKSERS